MISSSWIGAVARVDRTVRPSGRVEPAEPFATALLDPAFVRALLFMSSISDPVECVPRALSGVSRVISSFTKAAVPILWFNLIGFLNS